MADLEGGRRISRVPIGRVSCFIIMTFEKMLAKWSSRIPLAGLGLLSGSPGSDPGWLCQ